MTDGISKKKTTNQKHKKAEVKTKSQHSITQSGHTKDSNITLSV